MTSQAKSMYMSNVDGRLEWPTRRRQRRHNNKISGTDYDAYGYVGEADSAAPHSTHQSGFSSCSTSTQPDARSASESTACCPDVESCLPAGSEVSRTTTAEDANESKIKTASNDKKKRKCNKKKRKCKHIQSNKIRRPRNPYILYIQARRATLKMENPSMNSKEMCRVMGQEWRVLDDEKRSPFVALSLAESARYKREVSRDNQKVKKMTITVVSEDNKMTFTSFFF